MGGVSKLAKVSGAARSTPALCVLEISDDRVGQDATPASAPDSLPFFTRRENAIVVATPVPVCSGAAVKSGEKPRERGGDSRLLQTDDSHSQSSFKTGRTEPRAACLLSRQVASSQVGALAKSRLPPPLSSFSPSRAPYAEVSVRLQLLEGHRRRGRRRAPARLRGGAQVRLRGLHHRHPLPRPREAVAAGGGDRPGGQGAGVRAAGGLRRRPLRARGLRGRALRRPRRGARLQRLRAAGSQRRRRGGRAPHAVPRHHPQRLPPRSRRVRRRGLPLRAAGHPGHGGEGQGHHHLHRLLRVGHRLRRLHRSKLRQVCPPGVVPVAGQGVPAGRRAHCACDHRRRHRREEVAEEHQQGRRQRRRHGGRGPGRGGAELLARPRPGQERVDAGDGHPVAVIHVAAAAAASPTGLPADRIEQQQPLYGA